MLKAKTLVHNHLFKLVSTEVLHPDLGPSVQEESGAAGVGPKESHEDWRAGVPFLNKKAEGVRLVQPAESSRLNSLQPSSI